MRTGICLNAYPRLFYKIWDLLNVDCGHPQVIESNGPQKEKFQFSFQNHQFCVHWGSAKYAVTHFLKFKTSLVFPGIGQNLAFFYRKLVSPLKLAHYFVSKMNVSSFTAPNCSYTINTSALNFLLPTWCLLSACQPACLLAM